ncbi:regulatory protein RecX [Agromyces sp. Marseille-Q5079]|uniref:regulatory protein RecX n=1 Tax=Agromyces sp. Marseille-Q5079 TaxID=3439059 RepID=UPI003D9CAADB
MSDASEHIAPVSYLPWANPAPDDERVESSSGASEPRGQRSDGAAPSSGSGRWGRSTRSGSSSRASGGRANGRGERASLAAVDAADGDADDAREAETGPERDDRIDRIIVSRLRRSALSVAEVRSVLVEHGLDQGEVEEWIERYERFGYLDDTRLAEQLVHVHAGRRGRGSGAILQELTRRGVDAEAARTAIEGLDPETEFDNARAVAERRVRQLRGLERQVAERRLSAFLQRRGYSGEVVRQVVTEVLTGEGS